MLKHRRFEVAVFNLEVERKPAVLSLQALARGGNRAKLHAAILLPENLKRAEASPFRKFAGVEVEEICGDEEQRAVLAGGCVVICDNERQLVRHFSSAEWHLCFLAVLSEPGVGACVDAWVEGCFAAMHEHGVVLSGRE